MTLCGVTIIHDRTVKTTENHWNYLKNKFGIFHTELDNFFLLGFVGCIHTLHSVLGSVDIPLNYVLYVWHRQPQKLMQKQQNISFYVRLGQKTKLNWDWVGVGNILNLLLARKVYDITHWKCYIKSGCCHYKENKNVFPRSVTVFVKIVNKLRFVGIWKICFFHGALWR